MGWKAHVTFSPKISPAGVFISRGRVMTNNALIYRRPSKWPIAAALAAAVLIHFSAVAIVFHQELPAAVSPSSAVSGLAVDAMMEQSIGNLFLDNSTVSAFRRWRFKSGTPPRVRIPITFVLTGA